MNDPGRLDHGPARTQKALIVNTSLSFLALMESVYSAKKYVESVIYTLLPFKVHSETSRHVCCKSDMWGVYGNTPSMLVRVAGLSGAAAVALAAYGTHGELFYKFYLFFQI